MFRKRISTVVAGLALAAIVIPVSTATADKTFLVDAYRAGLEHRAHDKHHHGGHHGTGHDHAHILPYPHHHHHPHAHGRLIPKYPLPYFPTRTYVGPIIHRSFVTTVVPRVYVQPELTPVVSPADEVVAAHAYAKAQAEAPVLTDADGWWKSENGTLRLLQKGRSVTGTLYLKNGRRATLKGQQRGDTIVFDWQIAEGIAGNANLKLIEGGRRLIGSYASNGGSPHGWMLVRQSDRN